MMDSTYRASIDDGDSGVRSDISMCLVAFAACLLFRLPALGDLQLWYDEVITADAIRNSWGGMIRERLSQGHFPTYFAVLKGLGLSGSSEFALRLPSVVADCAAGGLVAVMARRIGGAVCALAAALLYATFPILIVYAQEARPYALQLLCVTLAMFGQIALLRRAGSVRWSASLATIGALGAILIIPASVVIVALQHLALLHCGVVRRGAPERRLWIHHIAVTWIAGIVALAFLVPSVLAQAGKSEGLMKWQKNTSLLGRVKGVLNGTYGFSAPEDLDRYLPHQFNAPLMWSFFALVAIGLIANRHSLVHRYLAVLAVGTFLAFIGIAVFTAVVNRYLIGMMPAAVLLASTGAGVLFANPRSRWLAGSWMALFSLGVGLQGIDTLGSPRKYDWRPIISFLHDNGVRKTAVHSDFFLIRKELGYYADVTDEIEFGTIIGSAEPIDKLWKAAANLPISWFILTVQREAPPVPMPAGVACTWSFGKMKVVMVARDHTEMPASLGSALADPRICVFPTLSRSYASARSDADITASN
ncbi:MAG: glycosyltransferase family 39 protein [Candidatus Kaistia colombiensis]|nr:MAG: glycosyltransferase family 39 protein [Kaistia sp.]